jgi:hypothetical protein
VGAPPSRPAPYLEQSVPVSRLKLQSALEGAPRFRVKVAFSGRRRFRWNAIDCHELVPQDLLHRLSFCELVNQLVQIAYTLH